MYRNRSAYHIYLQKFETQWSCLLNCRLSLAWEPRPLLHYQVPEKQTHMYYANDYLKTKAFCRDLLFFHLCRFLIKPIRKPIDHCVGVIFYFSLHLFWFHVDKQNILLPLCALFSPHIHTMTDRGRESLVEHRTGLCERGCPTVSIQ